MKTAHQIAAQIEKINAETIWILRAKAAEAFALVNTPDRQQQILNAFPDLGLIPAQAVAAYAAFHGALSAIGQADGLTAPNLEVFVPNYETGAVTYIAPPPPEPEPEEEP